MRSCRGNNICWISTKTTIVPCAVSLWNTFIYKMMIIQPWSQESQKPIIYPFARKWPCAVKQVNWWGQSLSWSFQKKGAKRASERGKIKKAERKGVSFFFTSQQVPPASAQDSGALAHITEKLTNEANLAIRGKPPQKKLTSQHSSTYFSLGYYAGNRYSRLAEQTRATLMRLFMVDPYFVCYIAIGLPKFLKRAERYRHRHRHYIPKLRWQKERELLLGCAMTVSDVYL